MPKVISSPVAKFPGTVTLADPLTFPQLLAFEQAVEQAQAVIAREGTQAEYDAALLPGLLACVVACDMAALPPTLTPENFPAAPRKASNALIAWLSRSVGQLIRGDEALPPD